MSNRRRRRRGDDESDLSEHEDKNLTKEKDDISEDLELSDYESLEDESEEEWESSDEESLKDQEHVANDKVKNKSVSCNENEDLQDYTEIKKIHILPNTKRESGDGKEESGKEQSPERKEDVKLMFKQQDEMENENEKEDPSFIPRLGAFFQHDMRTDDTKNRYIRNRNMQKVQKKWQHDKFILEEQMPKSQNDILDEYGYDIRSVNKSEIMTRPRKPRNRRRVRGNNVRNNQRRPTQQQQKSTDSMNHQQQPNEQEKVNESTENNPPMQGNLRNSRQSGRDGLNPRPNTRQREYFNNTRISNKSNQTITAERKEAGANKETEKQSEEAKNKEFGNLLNVISKKEQNSSSKESSKIPDTKAQLNLSQHTFKQQERRPKRYSSLRQNTGGGDASNTRNWRRAENKSRYSNFAKPTIPNIHPTSFNESVKSGNNEDSYLSHNLNTPPVSVNDTHSPQPATTSTEATYPADFSQHPQVPEMSIPPVTMFPRMINPPMQYYQSPAYQQLCQQMNQQLLVESVQQQPTSSIPLQNETNQPIVTPDGIIPPNINSPTVLPPHTQAMNSIIQQQQQIHLPSPYFQSQIPGMQLPYQPGLIGQQVGGVTYFNTPSQQPVVPSQPLPASQMSPARRPTAAIPIKNPDNIQFGMPATGAVE